MPFLYFHCKRRVRNMHQVCVLMPKVLGCKNIVHWTPVNFQMRWSKSDPRKYIFMILKLLMGYAPSLSHGLYQYFSRIVQVDLKFPPKPIVSSTAKDLISQVLLSLHFQKRISLSTPLEQLQVSVICNADFFLLIIDAGEGFFAAAPTTQAPWASLDRSECRSLWCL